MHDAARGMFARRARRVHLRYRRMRCAATRCARSEPPGRRPRGRRRASQFACCARGTLSLQFSRSSSGILLARLLCVSVGGWGSIPNPGITTRRAREHRPHAASCSYRADTCGVDDAPAARGPPSRDHARSEIFAALGRQPQRLAGRSVRGAMAAGGSWRSCWSRRSTQEGHQSCGFKKSSSFDSGESGSGLRSYFQDTSGGIDVRMLSMRPRD